MPTANQQREEDLNATATAASGKSLTEQSAGKFNHEAIQMLAKAVGILSVASNSKDVRGGSATGWIPQPPEGKTGQKAASAGHVFFDRGRGMTPEKVNFVAFDQAFIPTSRVREFEGDLARQIAVSPAYSNSVANGTPDEAHDVAIFTLDPFQAPAAGIPFDPRHNFQPGEELLILSYSHELVGTYPNTQDVDPRTTTMGVALATVQSIEGGEIKIRSEVQDTGASGSPVIAERNGKYFAVAIIVTADPNDQYVTYAAPLHDLEKLF